MHCDCELVSVEHSIPVDVRQVPDLAQDGHGELGPHHHLTDLKLWEEANLMRLCNRYS